MATRKKDWILTPEAFEQLLAAFDADRDRAGQRYENVRRKLIEFFEARGSNSPADHADETINRVARRLHEGESPQNLSAYFYGVARLLLKEAFRGFSKEPLALDLVPAPPLGKNDEEHERRRWEENRRLKCFEVCLGKLPALSRDLIVEYYREEKGLKIKQRKLQADALNVSPNALRLRACRIRTELCECIETCIARFEGDTEIPIDH